MRSPLLPILLACLLGFVASHSWVEELLRVASNGTLVGPSGYSDGWNGRGAGFNDDLYTNRLPSQGVKMCKTAGQPQPASFPHLTAAPGDFISLRYQENGHVTKPESPGRKPLNRGTIFIYGTTQPKLDDTVFDAHRQWTVDGKGGDGRGRLLATRNYDDLQCHQVNDSPISQKRKAEFAHTAIQPMGDNIWCQAAFQIPEDVAQGASYSIYWVWSWPTFKTQADTAGTENGVFPDFPPQDAHLDKRALISDRIETAEVYTSCSTIKIQGEKLVKGATDSASAKNSDSLAGFSFPSTTDYNVNAIKVQLQNQFLVAVDGAGVPDSSPGNGTQSSLPSSALTSSPTPTSSPDGNKARVVTVTAEALTMYSVLTVTVSPQPTPTPSNSAGGDGEVQPTPFLQGRHIRGRDSWNFHQRV
ncbi:hypothetical protein CTRI78_v004907 [Colletotrichum trifolii]|uniref:DUF7492 domain-containing protein n=1 Tax=Colletotrichum trifolii TaxID=5466 RepID=A0A4R8RGA9_COLTR|nr:hypothetical protein CTRI78_v004907 [Colletotrichum trifolii]